MASTAAVTGAWTLQSSNNAQEGRLHDGAFLAQANPINSSASPNVTWRNGVLPTTSTGSTPVDLLVVTNATPDMSVRVYPGNWVVTRPGQGPYVGFSSTLTPLTIAAANTTNPRIDLVYAQVLDGALGDTGTLAQVGVVTGVPAVSPAVPALPANAIPLAQVAVAANATTITSGNITDIRKSSALQGSTRTLLPGDSLSDPGFRPGEQRDTGTTIDRWDGSTWVPILYATVGGHARYSQTTAMTNAAVAATWVKQAYPNAVTSSPDVTPDASFVNWTINRAGLWRIKAGARIAPTNVNPLRFLFGVFPAATPGTDPYAVTTTIEVDGSAASTNVNIDTGDIRLAAGTVVCVALNRAGTGGGGGGNPSNSEIAGQQNHVSLTWIRP